MNRDFITVPPGLFTSLDFNWEIDWRGQEASQANDGSSQFVFNAFPRWVGTPMVHLDRSKIAKWRAIRARARGRLGLYVISIQDPLTFLHEFETPGIPFDTGERFDTGYGFAKAPFVTNTVAAAAGAQTLTIEASVAPKQGQIMSYQLRPFIVTYVDDLGAGSYEIGIEMALREAIPAGGLIDLNAKGIFEVVDPSMGNPTFDNSWMSTPQLSFQEYLNL